VEIPNGQIRLKMRVLASFIIVWCAINASTIPSRTVKKVVISGGGPAGLLAAYALLERKGPVQYDVSLLESRPDPRLMTDSARAYSLGLNIRGQTAIRTLDAVANGESESDTVDSSGGMWPAIASKGVESDSFFLHVGRKKFHIRKPVKPQQQKNPTIPPPTLLIPRSGLCGAMLDVLESRYGADANNAKVSNARFKIAFNTELQNLNLRQQTCSFVSDLSKQGDDTALALDPGIQQQLRLATGGRCNYDLFVGADGVSSVARRCIVRQQNGNLAEKGEEEGGKVPTEEKQLFVQEDMLPGNFKVWESSPPPELEPASIHALNSGKAGYNLFCIPAPANRMCVLVSWGSGSTAGAKTSGKEDPSGAVLEPEALASLTSFRASLAQHYPLLGNVTHGWLASSAATSALRQVVSDPEIGHAEKMENPPAPQRPSDVRVVRCSRYHHSEGKVVLIGDAAHSTGGTLGQGANSGTFLLVCLCWIQCSWCMCMYVCIHLYYIILY
jgi:2-polyprenyl-6-methoxyphenol hydroxylase-like FAD-dependent oxidoreductase